MNHRGIDLNQLVLFEALVRERHVSRAAERVGLSQPAMSQALARLRVLFNDPILERQGAHMVPTPTALRLLPRVSEILTQSMTLVTGEQPFVPADCERTFRLGMTDYASACFLPDLLGALRKQAPAARILVLHFGRNQGAAAVLDGEVDLAMGNFLQQDHLGLHPLSVEKYVCAVAQDHPFAGDRMTLDEYLSYPHLLVASSGEASGIVDFELALRGRKRNIACTVPHFLVAPMLLTRTTMILTLMERLLRQNEEKYGLRLLEAPITIPEYRSYLAWDPGRESDKAVRWVRSLIVELFADPVSSAPASG